MKILELSSEFNLKLNSLDEHNIKMQIQKEQLVLRLNQEKKFLSEESWKKFNKNEHRLDDIKILTYLSVIKRKGEIIAGKIK